MNIIKLQRYFIVKLLIFLSVFHIFCFTSFIALANPHQNKFIEVQLTKVIDGDTFYVLYCGLPIKVRLYGIDAPERGEKGYKKATLALTYLLEQQENIGLEIVNYDGFGRAVAITYVGDGKTAQERLLIKGVVSISKKYCKLDICDYWNNIAQ